MKSRPYNYANYRRWYLKMKADVVRYREFLTKNKEWNRAYRKSSSKKYEKLLERRNLRRSLNPFPRREKALAYYQKIKADVAAYQAMLAKRREQYKETMQRLRADPEKYRAYLEQRMVYHRYYRITQRAANGM